MTLAMELAWLCRFVLALIVFGCLIAGIGQEKLK